MGDINYKYLPTIAIDINNKRLRLHKYYYHYKNLRIVQHMYGTVSLTHYKNYKNKFNIPRKRMPRVRQMINGVCLVVSFEKNVLKTTIDNERNISPTLYKLFYDKYNAYYKNRMKYITSNYMRNYKYNTYKQTKLMNVSVGDEFKLVEYNPGEVGSVLGELINIKPEQQKITKPYNSLTRTYEEHIFNYYYDTYYLRYIQTLKYDPTYMVEKNIQSSNIKYLMREMTMHGDKPFYSAYNIFSDTDITDWIEEKNISLNDLQHSYEYYSEFKLKFL